MEQNLDIQYNQLLKSTIRGYKLRSLFCNREIISNYLINQNNELDIIINLAKKTEKKIHTRKNINLEVKLLQLKVKFDFEILNF